MGRSAFRKTALAAALFAGITLPAFADEDAVLKQAEQLLAQQQPKAAYDLLAPLEDERAGNPDYDYLLGLSALESGNAGQAAFAFERCLTVDPKNGPCRVQMARTHLALGENKSARQELDTIQSYNPPPAVQKMVATYLGDLSRAQAAQQRQVSAYAEAGVGYDSNANSATGSSTIALPDFFTGYGTLSPNAVKQSSGFAQALAGASGQYNLNSQWSLIGDADVNGRGYPNHDDFKYLYGDLNFGGAYHDGASQYSLKLQNQDYELDGNLFRRLWGAIAQYQHSYSDNSQMTAYLQRDRLGYPDNSPFDSTRNTLGGAYSTGLPLRYSPVVFGGAYFGNEATAGEGEYAYNSQHFVGLRGGGTAFLNDRLALNSTLAAERRVYDAITPGFGDTRGDIQYDFSLGLTYMLQKGLSLRPLYTYTRSNSNIVVDNFSRNVISLDLRYEM